MGRQYVCVRACERETRKTCPPGNPTSVKDRASHPDAMYTSHFTVFSGEMEALDCNPFSLFSPKTRAVTQHSFLDARGRVI